MLIVRAGHLRIIEDDLSEKEDVRLVNKTLDARDTSKKSMKTKL